MSYSDFTLDTVYKVLEVTFHPGDLFQNVASLEVPPWLREALHKGMQLALLSEKVRSELIVMPVLLTCRAGGPHDFWLRDDGEAWQFLKLVQTTLTIDRGRYYIDNVGQILGMFEAIIACYETGSVAA
jgi:hypothetical protein